MCKKFLIQTYGQQLFYSNFSQKFKKSQKICLFLHYLNNLLQILRICSLFNKKKTLFMNFINTKNKSFIKYSLKKSFFF